MWGFHLFFLWFMVPRLTSHQIETKCHEFSDAPTGIPRLSNTFPSKLVGLKVEQVRENGIYKLNISWAINVDASTRYVTGTIIQITNYEDDYLCEYKPPLANANLTGLEKVWLHFTLVTIPGCYYIVANNLPQTGYGIPSDFMDAHIEIPDDIFEDPTKVAPKSTQTTIFLSSPEPPSLEAIPSWKSLTVLAFGILAIGMILGSCCVMYNFWRLNTTSSFALENWFTDTMALVPVLVVYPAVNSAFQGAVLALAEFLQFNCSCTVTIDIWQQGKIAELGPMRWLAEQSKAVHHVLIVSPQSKTPSSPLKYPLKQNLPEPLIPAAAHDLYPLVLNMVASHAKNAQELAKFCVVQLSEKRTRSSLPLELRTCKTFCLMKDLNKLCRCLHSQRHNKKMSDVIRPRDLYGPKSALKLREAIEKLKGGKTDISAEMDPLKTVIITV